MTSANTRPLPPQKKRKKHGRRWIIAIVLLLAVLAGGMLAFRLFYVNPHYGVPSSKEVTRAAVMKEVGLTHAAKETVQLKGTESIRTSVWPWAQEVQSLRVQYTDKDGKLHMVLIPIDDEKLNFKSKKGATKTTATFIWADAEKKVTASAVCKYNRWLVFFGSHPECDKPTVRTTDLYKDIVQKGLTSQLGDELDRVVIEAPPKVHRELSVRY